MKTILVTGANGFIGKNLCRFLQSQEGNEVCKIDIESDESDLENYVKKADIIFHLAGINRPIDEKEFFTGNVDFTKRLMDLIDKFRVSPLMIVSSSIQAESNNPYGISKKMAEDALIEWKKKNGSKVIIYRLSNVFGKWARPNYNSVVATFCHQIANGIPPVISNGNSEVAFNYIDDVVDEFANAHPNGDADIRYIGKTYKCTVSELCSLIEDFNMKYALGIIPDISTEFKKHLYSTYLSYLPNGRLCAGANVKRDFRGDLVEILKTVSAGQVFISTSKPGITRGDHFHHSKTERFCVLKGSAQIKIRDLRDDQVQIFDVSGEEIEIVTIPPGCTHSIRNTGNDDMLAVFWANELFDPEKPDTYSCKV